MANLDLLNEFWKRTEQEQMWRGYAPQIRQARPFSLDDDFADVTAKLMLSPPKELHRSLLTARLPYPVMWLEVDHAHSLAHIERDAGSSSEPYHLTKVAPERVGWLLVETPNGEIAATRVARVQDPVTGELGKAMMYPLTYLLSSERRMTIDGQTFRSLEGTVHPDILSTLRTWNKAPLAAAAPWGWNGRVMNSASVDDAGFDVFDAEYADSPLRETCVTLIEPRAIMRLLNPRPGEDQPLADRVLNLLLSGHNDQYGDIAFIVSALAMINSVPVKYVPFRPSGSLRAGGRLRPYMQTSIVSIEVPATRRRIKDLKGLIRQRAHEAQVRARHEVRGHWRHVKQPPKVASDNQRWERWNDPVHGLCWRTWIEHHERGSGRIGYVRQTYEVVRGKGAIPGFKGDVNVGTSP